MSLATHAFSMESMGERLCRRLPATQPLASQPLCIWGSQLTHSAHMAYGIAVPPAASPFNASFQCLYIGALLSNSPGHLQSLNTRRRSLLHSSLHGCVPCLCAVDVHSTITTLARTHFYGATEGHCHWCWLCITLYMRQVKLWGRRTFQQYPGHKMITHTLTCTKRTHITAWPHTHAHTHTLADAYVWRTIAPKIQS